MATHTDAKMYVRICECPDPNVPRHFTRDTQHIERRKDTTDEK